MEPSRRVSRAANAQEPRRWTRRSAQVSHTLDPDLNEHLEDFASSERISKNSIIEFALRVFFERGYDSRLGRLLQRGGIGPHRKPPVRP